MLKKWKWLAAILLLLTLSGSAALAQAQDITGDCQYWVSEGSYSKITDTSIKTGWTPSGINAEVRFGFPAGTGYLAVEWGDDPTGFVFSQYDENLNPISATSEKESFVGISQMFVLDPKARYASLTLTQPNQSVQKVRIYSEGELPPDVKNWLAPYEKCDLMVVSTHQDDEWIFFGGIIPYYDRVQEKRVQVVYMANCGRTRKGEALNGLWASGCLHHPEFIDLVDKRLSSIEDSLALWGGAEVLTGELVERIRRFRPEVILTHDWDGEYGHNQHKLTARFMEQAIVAAADPNMYPESSAKYGAWQVKKLYLHLATESPVDFDWNVKYDQLDGQTPLEVAKLAYSKHESQQKYYQVEDGGKYDNSLFGLTYSVVGDDVLHNDLFENVVPEPTATPEPTVTPEPVATQEPAAELQETPAPTAEPVAANEKGGGAGKVIGLLAGAAALAASGVLALRIREKRRRKRRRRRRRVQPGAQRRR